MESYEALRSSSACVDLSARGKIRVLGEDRARLLHAMSTNDVNHLESHAGVYAFFLTVQGRILADSYIYNLGDSLFLDTEPEVGGKLRDHLDKYIIADDATLEDESERWAVLGIEGPQFTEAAGRLSLPVPASAYGVAEWQAGFVSRAAATNRDGIRVFLPAEQKEDLLRKMKEFGIPQASVAEAKTVRLEHGVPRYGEDITERYLVQETQQLQAVHTNKGCYLGQEIVERVRSRGQVHRWLMPVRIGATQPPPPGTKFGVEGKDAGEITSAAYSPAFGQVVGLAYVRAEAAQARRDLYIQTGDGQTTVSLPARTSESALIASERKT
jgi:folate-binding protein YgfZ